MARDYFSDIQSDKPEPRRVRLSETPATPSSPPPPAAGNERSIRNISVPQRRQPSQRIGSNDIRLDRTPEMSAQSTAPTKERRQGAPRLMLWGVAGLSVVVLGGLLLVLLWAHTTVTVTPRTHQVTFDPSNQFTAYPEGAATAGALSYSLQASSFEEYAVVPATGTEQAEDRASGTVTVYNQYSTSPVRLIKNTRFESPNGLVFRIPASVEVPGKKGDTPGEISITVFADQPGPAYNLGAIDRFTIPGLKNSPDMYNGVFAQSMVAFAGGFVGQKPAVAPQALESARTELRGKLSEKARSDASAISDGFAFPEMIQIRYESLPVISEPQGGARVTERAFLQIPVFPAQSFAKAIAEAVSADASESTVMLKPQAGFSAKPSAELPESLQDTPLVFSLLGSATIVWDVQASQLAQALAGREQAAFETIIGTFPGVEKAQANIAPFWSSTFPEDAADIEIKVVEPAQQ